MKLNRNVRLLVLAMAGIGIGAVGIASAQTPAPAAPAVTMPMPGHGWQRHHGGMLLGMTLRATRQLNLTADQKASIKSILENARAQMKAAHASGQAPVDMVVLGNPGDPNYATALQSAKTLAANRIQTESELQGQIYNVLTAEQKAQLPTVLASMKAQAAQRRANWEQRHAAATSAG
ncbi:MAG TPA: Spy/CpxP family protein refolding chaperone [Steroidobacteraceae bacterium]